MAFVDFDHVGKTYHMGEVKIRALHDASFSIEKGEFAVIVAFGIYLFHTRRKLLRRIGIRISGELPNGSSNIFVMLVVGFDRCHQYFTSSPSGITPNTALIKGS